MPEYSIIIPTHNRQSLMEKNIKYFSSFGNVSVYICDSTEEAYTGKFPKNITYLHKPGLSFVKKMAATLLLVETPVVAVCADDDFVLQETINGIVEKIVKSGYSMGVGRYFGFNIPYSGFFPLYGRSRFPNVSSENREKRIKSFLGKYHMSLWAVYDTAVLKKAYNILLQANVKNDNFIELVIASIAASEGKIYFTNKTLGVRECQNKNRISWGRLQPNIRTYALQEEFKVDMENLNRAVGDNSIRLGINAYIQAGGNKKRLSEMVVKRLQNIFPVKNFYDERIFSTISSEY